MHNLVMPNTKINIIAVCTNRLAG